MTIIGNRHWSAAQWPHFISELKLLQTWHQGDKKHKVITAPSSQQTSVVILWHYVFIPALRQTVPGPAFIVTGVPSRTVICQWWHSMSRSSWPVPAVSHDSVMALLCHLMVVYGRVASLVICCLSIHFALSGTPFAFWMTTWLFSSI